MNIKGRDFQTDRCDIFGLGGCFFVLMSLKLPFGEGVSKKENIACYENKHYRQLFDVDGESKFFLSHGISLDEEHKLIRKVIASCLTPCDMYRPSVQ